ncbi:hypothetical protein WJ47_32130 [Burkholderia ubonensis]|uniref:DUF1460 domain-containing protein n=1 Tax=Burkholderia ubonensis TaxID=101571 RepID=A0AB73G4V7_9BURK|nr:DUF1460 domain-containing protein [Burkholderia ubonensis]KVK94706.1 hypothetical protein WJ44_22335 [Burkholderia ubonensis]KVL76827.1 hypothetical protein WJ47_32130 [Burkholderia ubonensis]KVM34517.1 hypothetical protein WJ53_33285 [Burkholderia ubonensis]KVM38404.1 hypothetical protein WJ54_31935 [Burkholderia ubonensis]
MAIEKTLGKLAPLVLALALAGCGGDASVSALPQPDETTTQQQAALASLNEATSSKLDALLAIRAAHRGDDAGRLVEALSREFIGIPYRDGMLEGSATTPERLVIDFSGLDCFTYLDYVEAARTATTRTDYASRLVRTRYVNGDIGFRQRRHFFTDWAARPQVLADDVTASISARAATVTKQLNRKADGGAYLPGLPVVQRDVVHIPGEFVDDYVVSRLRTGDFIGIYAKAEGLDVTHVGFFVETRDGPMLRNASSKKANMKVVDSPFLEYVKNTPGIVVLRPRA